MAHSFSFFRFPFFEWETRVMNQFFWTDVGVAVQNVSVSIFLNVQGLALFLSQVTTCWP